MRALIILCLATTLVGGCASTIPSVKDRAEWTQAISSGNQSLVIGRMQLVVNGEEKKLGKGWFSPSLMPILLRTDDGWVTNGDLNESGEIIWTVNPGTYVINKITIVDPWSGGHEIATNVTFRVPNKGQVYYIGSLKLNLASSRDLIGNIHGNWDIVIEDQGAVAYAAVANELDIVESNIQKQLMVYTGSALPLREAVGDKLRIASEASSQWALNMLQRAAQNGDAVAQFELGLLYFNGHSVPQDRADAVIWWRKAAQHGNVRAYIDLVVLFENDQRMLQVDAAGVVRLREDAVHGDANAQYSLGLLYTNGQEVPQDYAEADMWFRKAAKQGYAKAKHKLGVLYYTRRQSDHLKWLRTAPSMVVSFALNIPGLIDFNQLNTPEENAEAARWFLDAADQGNVPAQSNLGILYERGQGVPQDYAEAAKRYRFAAEQKFDFAQSNLGRLYENGLGVQKNQVIAYALYNLARANGADVQRLAENMTALEIKEAQRLTQEMQKPQNISRAIDQYLGKASVIGADNATSVVRHK